MNESPSFIENSSEPANSMNEKPSRARSGQKPRRSGRPSTRTAEVERMILDAIMRGRSLTSVCDKDEGMPAKESVLAWLASDKERQIAKRVEAGEVLFLDRYNIAVEMRTEAHAEEILAISDDGRNDMYTDDKGNTVVDYDHIQRCKLRVDSRKWLLSKLLPKKYGDRPTAEVNVNNAVHNHQHISQDELQRLQERRRQIMER